MIRFEIDLVPPQYHVSKVLKSSRHSTAVSVECFDVVVACYSHLRPRPKLKHALRRWRIPNTLLKNVCSNGTIFFVGAAGDGAAPTMACSGPTRPATPTNGTVGLAGDTSRLYKWVGFVGAAHSPAAPGVAICRGGW